MRRQNALPSQVSIRTAILLLLAAGLLCFVLFPPKTGTPVEPAANAMMPRVQTVLPVYEYLGPAYAYAPASNSIWKGFLFRDGKEEVYAAASQVYFPSDWKSATNGVHFVRANDNFFLLCEGEPAARVGRMGELTKR